MRPVPAPVPVPVPVLARIEGRETTATNDMIRYAWHSRGMKQMLRQ